MNLFKRNDIYNMIFFNILSVTEYDGIDSFKEKEPHKFETWKRMAIKRYDVPISSAPVHPILNKLYLEKACYLPEFSKIIHISYALPERGETDAAVSRKLISIKGENELDLIKSFITILNEQHVQGNETKPKYIPILCGHNIVGHDIPLFVKRMLVYRHELIEEFGFVIPLPIRHYLDCKPWDSNLLDTVLAWKFNGGEFISLNLVAEFLGLKKTELLLPKEEINSLYWTGIEDDEGSTKTKIRMQSANFTNVAFQLVKELRIL